MTAPPIAAFRSRFEPNEYTIGALDPGAAIGGYAIDAFASVLRVDVASLRHDVQTAADFAVNALAIRRDDRKAAADGRRFLTTVLPSAEHTARRVSQLNPAQVARNTVAKTGTATEQLIETAIRQARDLSATLRALLAERGPVRLPAGGGGDQDQLCARLIERLANVWTRYTNKPAPGGASGPFVEFVVAAWIDLEFPEFTGGDGTPNITVAVLI